ncbi:MAG: transcription factor S [Candidatus Woesearchaeota archaeon]|jgi:DNA-directed RNA polymerase subunit M
MLFCQKCGSLLIPCTKEGKRVMKCNSCSFVSKDLKETKISEKVAETKEVEVIDKEIEINPICDTECHSCHHKKAYYWFEQTRCSDEPATRFFKCVKCAHVWREY